MSLDLPPSRELPDDVRARLRATVEDGITRRPRHGVLVVAAAVALLVIGAASVVRLYRPSPAEPRPEATMVTPEAQRCWQAVEKAGKASHVPPAEQWRVVYTQSKGSDTVVALQADGKLFFCELTSTTVTLSDPNATPAYAPGTRTGLLLYTATGLAAGITDSSLHHMDFYVGDLGAAESDVAPTGQFSAFTARDPAKDQLSAWARGDAKGPGIAYVGSRIPLPAPQPPLFSVVDAPAERTSPAGKALKECLDGVAEKLPDADTYQPGALLEDGRYRVVLGKSGLHAVACTAQPDPKDPAKTVYRLYHDTFIGLSIPVRRLSVDALGSRVPFVGIVPQDTKTMIADLTGRGPDHPQVVNGTFAMWLPEGARSPSQDGTVWVRADNAAGASLFNGWVPLK